MTGILALPASYTSKIVQALEQTHRPALIWLEFQDCAGNTESALRASHPSFADIVLDLLSWNYHETVMVPSGKAAEKSLQDTIMRERGQYIVVSSCSTISPCRLHGASRLLGHPDWYRGAQRAGVEHHHRLQVAHAPPLGCSLQR